MPYRDSAEAGEKGTDEERGEAESTRESKAVISSLNSMELSKNRFRRWETVPFAAHGVPEMPFGDRIGRAPKLRLRRKAAEGETKQEPEKEKKQHE